MILDGPTAMHFSRIAHETGDVAVLRRRELAMLASSTGDGEDVFGLTHGVMDSRTWIVALTDVRLILISHPRMRGKRRIEIALQDLESIVPVIGRFTSALQIATMTGRHVIGRVPRTAVESFALTTSKLSVLCGRRQSSDAYRNRLSRVVAELVTDLV